MTQFTERFKNHSVWQLMEKLGPEIDNALNREGIDAVSIERLARLKAVLTFIGKRLAGADAYLLQVGPLDSLSTSLEELTREVLNFIANGDPNHINNTNSHADNALSHLSQLNVLLTTEDFISAKEAAESYRSGLEKVLNDVKNSSSKTQNETNSLQSRIEELSAAVNAEQAKIAGFATEFQAQFSTSQEARNNEFAGAQKERQDQFAAFHAQFLEIQDTRSREFADTQKERQDRFSNLYNEYVQKLGEQNNEFTKQREEIARLHQGELEQLKKSFVDVAENLRSEILKRKVEVEKLVGVIGNLGVTSGYLKTANEAKTTVRVWQVVAVISMIGLIAVAIHAFLPVVGGSFTWSGFAGRVFVSLTFGALAAYAASQADKYQKMERQNRRLALELEAIGPFLAPLPIDKQEEFRLKIGDRSFGQGDAAQSGIDGKSPVTVLDAMLESKEFRTFLTEIIKAAR